MSKCVRVSLALAGIDSAAGGSDVVELGLSGWGQDAQTGHGERALCLTPRSRARGLDVGHACGCSARLRQEQAVPGRLENVMM